METIGFSNHSKGDSYINMKDKVTGALKDFFRPEFLNRLDEIVVFDILSPEAIREIVEIRLAIVKKRLAGKGITLDLTDEALDFLAREGYNPQMGARPLNRLIQSKILNPIASHLINIGADRGDTVHVGVKDGDLSIETKQKSRRIKSPLNAKKKREKVVK